MIKIKSYSSVVLLSVVLLAACSKQQIKPKSSDLNSEDVQGSRANGCDTYILVSTQADLSNIKKKLAACYKQTADIDLSNENFEPIGDKDNPFTGTYDGNGTIIRNLTINKNTDKSNLGLFSYTGQNAVLKNITLKNVRISGRDTIGGLVGYNNGTIFNSSAIVGNIEGKNHLGGLVGYNDRGTTIEKSSVTDFNIIGISNVGGLVGSNEQIIKKSSVSRINITAVKVVGGLLGYNSVFGLIDSSYSFHTDIFAYEFNIGGFVGKNSGEIYNSFVKSGLTRGDKNVGGFVGRNSGLIFYSYASGRASGVNYIGGFVGSVYANNSTKIENSYSSTSVTGNDFLGGFVAKILSKGTSIISNSYTTGVVITQSGENVGGFLSYGNDSDPALSNNFQPYGTVFVNDTQVDGFMPSGVERLDKSQIKQDTFQAAGWAFPEIWKPYINLTWPTLQYVKPYQFN